MRPIFAALALSLALPVFAQGTVTVSPPADGSVSRDQGLEAFARIYEVVSHPRCSNCHVGVDNIPMWSGPSYGASGQHGMHVTAGESRIGAETVLCSTCHTISDRGNPTAHAAPRAALDWQLPPVEFAWFGKSALEICAQLSNPEQTGGRDWLALAEYLQEDASQGGFVHWGWHPGGGREAAPYDLQRHIDDVLIWGVAGQPCPDG